MFAVNNLSVTNWLFKCHVYAYDWLLINALVTCTLFLYANCSCKRRLVHIMNFLVVDKLAAEFIVLFFQMSVIFNESGLSDVQPPCVVQTFVNHNARLFKIFIIGRRRFIIQRPSIKNLFAGGIFPVDLRC